MNDRLHPSRQPPPAVETPGRRGVANARWRIGLLGGFRADDGARCLTRLHSRHVVALLARLTLWPQRDHPREELIELLWPGVDLAVGRNRLRQALSSLKNVLEAPGVPGAPLLQADRLSLRLAAGGVDCDVRDFERCAARGDRDAALALYRGELLPGFYDEWVLMERARLEALRDALPATSASPPSRPGERGAGNLSTAASPARGPGGPPAGSQATAPRPARPAPTPAPAPALRSVGERGLPSYLTRLFGADAQTAALRRAVREHRLVTVVGPGGGGKTRLAIEVARRLHWADAWVGSTSGAAADGHRGGAEVGGAAAGTSPEQAFDLWSSPFDSITLVPLLDAHSHGQLLDALRSALRIDSAADVVDGVMARLGGRPALLLLDNFEQLVGHGEALVARLAAALPQLHVLVTSRRSLGIDGERLFALAPLALPAADASLAAAAGNPAVALFADRAAAVRGDFRVSAPNHAAIVALVRLLEGSPLAIELAASRLRSFAPAELLARLQQPPAAGAAPPLDVLARHASAALDPRHASLNRTIAWSWALLTESQRALASAMTVFRGGCSAAMLQAVVEGAGDVRDGADTQAAVAGVVADAATAEPRIDARLGLDELLAHSLVQTLSNTGGEPRHADGDASPGSRSAAVVGDGPAGDASGGDGRGDGGRHGSRPGWHAAAQAGVEADVDVEPALRFQLYEPVREFAAAQLTPPRAAHWRARHRAWAIGWSEALPMTAPLAAVRAELPNLEAAFASAAADAAGDDAARLLLALRRALRFVMLAEHSLDHVACALARCGDAGLRIRARGVLAIQLIERGRKDDAQHQVEAGLAEAPAAVSPVDRMPADAAALRGHALISVAWQRWRSKNDAARVLPLIDETQLLAERCGDVELQFDLLALHGFVVSKGAADPLLPQALHRRGLALRLAGGDRHAVLSGRYNLGQAIFVGGDRVGGLAEFRAVAAQARAIGNWQMQSRADGACGCALSELRRWPESVDVLRQTLRSCWEESLSGSDLAYALWNLARPLAHVRLPLLALQVAGFISVHWVRHIGELSAEDRFDLRRVRRLAAVQCAPQACDEAWRRGEVLSLADAVALALDG